MKILHVCKKYPNALGGDAVVVSNLEIQQKKAGHKVVILTSNCDDIKNNKNVYKFGLKDTPANLDKITIKRILSLLVLFSRSFRLLSRQRPDIIHSHTPDMGFTISLAARLYKIPMIHTCHGFSSTDDSCLFIKKELELYFLKHSGFKKIIVLGPSLVDVLYRYGIKNTVYQQNGVDLDFWKPQDNVIKNKIFTFLAVGRLEDQKGFSYLLEATKELKKLDLPFNIIIAGDGDKKLDLIAQAKSLKVTNIVKFTGNRTKEQLRSLYNMSQALVISSIWEGFPLTIFEAWAMKLPVIATDVGDIGEVAGENVLLIQPRKPMELCNVMSSLLLNNDPKLIIKASKLVKGFGWDKVSLRIESLYEEVL
jgi:glycosyltransferase involved in cell wall biosynthesis